MSQNIWIFIVVLIVVLGIALVVMSSKKKCKYYKEDGKCVDECKNKIWDFTTKSCVESCPTGTIEINSNDGVLPYPPEWKACNKVIDEKCVKDEKLRLKLTSDGVVCVDSFDTNDIILGEENGLSIAIDKCDGYIHPITLKCLDSCGGEFPYEVTEKNSYGVIIKLCSVTKQQ